MTLLISPPQMDDTVNIFPWFDMQAIRRSVEQLPEMQKKVILCIDISGFSYYECSMALNITDTQLKRYLKQARQSLLAQLNNGIHANSAV